MIRCSKCNGTNIEQKAWIDPNDDTVLDLVDPEDECTDNCWCRDCEEHVEFLHDSDEEDVIF